jgi:hypothetical protein
MGSCRAGLSVARGDFSQHCCNTAAGLRHEQLLLALLRLADELEAHESPHTHTAVVTAADRVSDAAVNAPEADLKSVRTREDNNTQTLA